MNAASIAAGLLAVAAILGATAARAATIDGPLASALAAAGPDERLPVIVLAAGLGPATGGRAATTARRAAVRSLARRVVARGGDGSALRELWLAGFVAAQLEPRVIRRLAADPAVASLRLDAVVMSVPPPVVTGAGGGEGWNLDVVGARALNEGGLTGKGVVVANLDTGVDGRHPDLAPRWRGAPGGWFDPYGQHDAPVDLVGHGTQTMGLMVAGSATGRPTGVAPAARWIAGRLFDDAGQATLSAIHAAFQWVLDPDGDPETPDAPHVVNLSWGYAGHPGELILEFEPDLEALRAAGLAVVVAGGNDGPDPGTHVSPANNPAAFAVGAVGADLLAAPFSSRGPGPLPGGRYPSVVAPGVNVWATDVSGGGVIAAGTWVSGTSFAAAHVSGLLALLRQAWPIRPADELQVALEASARDVGAPGCDFEQGHGVVDGPAAQRLLLSHAVLLPPGDLTRDGRVDWDDHARLAQAWPAGDPGAGDADGDGDVDWDDFLFVQVRLGDAMPALR